MARDLEEAAREGDYLTDQSAANLRAAADELSRCGVFLPFSLGCQIERLKWYTPLERGKVLALQEALGRLGFGNLAQDGVYGPKTSEARSRFLE
ncbi:MAG TPA: peptidoglycan-binding domain-containing protein [Oscillospiraceae bacterium]|nr:peptidoglycan-binding domain-containing protein [Oscillospiraceae bacterium]